MSLTQKTIRAGMWALVQNGSRQVVSTLVFLALARFFLTKDEFGLVALAGLLIIFLNVLVRQGLGTAIVQRKEIQDIHLDTAFWVNVGVAIVLTLGVVATADTIAALLGDSRVSPILQVLSLAMVISSLSLTHEAILSRELRFKSLAIRTLTASIAGGIAGLGFAFAGGGVWALVAMQLTAAVGGVIVLWWASQWRPRLRFSSTALREMLPMSANMTGVSIVSVLNDLIDQLVIGRVLGTPALGVYVVAQRVVKLLVTVFVQSLTSVALPGFSRLNGDIERTRNALFRATRLSTFVAFPVFGGLAVTADLIVPMLFGGGWEEAVPVMSILCIWAALGSISFYFIPVLTAVGSPNAAFTNSAIGAVLLLVLCLIGASFGLTGVAAAVLLKTACMFPLWIASLRRVLGIRLAPFAAAFFANLMAMALMILAVAVFRNSVLIQTMYMEMMASIAIGFLVYLLMIWLVSKDVLADIGSLVKKR